MTSIYLIVAIGFSLMILERIIPDQKLPVVKKWWVRVFIINSIQLGVVILGFHTWEILLQRWSYFDLKNQVSPAVGALLAYAIVVPVFYFWHRWRHDSHLLWRLCHQVHHSPQRIETITSFYKHPLEIFMNSVIISLIVYCLLGLGPKAGALLTLYTACAEFFYHMNIKTPHWVGYIIQRPEMHRIHHQRGKHYNNFADLPFMDMLFGTYENPKTYQGKCGYKSEREARLFDMLLFKDVNGSHK